MANLTEFYTVVLGNAEAKEELASILNGTELKKASDAQLKKIGALAARLGYTITLEEAKAFLQKDRTLSEGELEAVAGGGSSKHDTMTIYKCDTGGQAGRDEDKTKPITRTYVNGQEQK